MLNARLRCRGREPTQLAADEPAMGSRDTDRSPGTPLAAMALACASLALWFWLTFPWQHHNESLVWAISLDKVSLWQTLTSNPIPSVQNARPLGVAMTWLTFHLSSGGIWLQQIVNFVITAAAWALACTACKRPLTFAWLAMICSAIFFSGYIYLFHLHGVFYPPLFVFIALLLIHQSGGPALDWRNALGGFALAVVVSMFHPFALLVFAAYISGLFVECRVDGRLARPGAAAVAVGAAVAVAAILVRSAGELGSGDSLQGLLTSFQLLEANRMVTAFSVLLSVLAGIALGRTWRTRAGWGAVVGLAALALMLAGLPVIFCWIAACLLNALRRGRLAMAVMIAACTAIPMATASGSPTYALFVFMPCIAAIADDLPLPGSQRLQRNAAIAATVAILAMLVGLRADVTLPGISGVSRPLRAEQEKTHQMMRAFDWLEENPEINGHLELCSAGTAPTAGNDALDRTFRAPTNAWAFDQYVTGRFGSRLTTGQTLALCFGGQTTPGAQVLYSIPGRWSGIASILRPVSDGTG